MFLNRSQQDVYIRDFYQALDCPRSLACHLLYTNGEHKQLAELSFNPSDYNHLDDARDALAATSFLAKATFLDTGLNLKEVAITKFLEAEVHCRETNRRLYREELTPLASSAITWMSHKIDMILGSFTAEEFVESCSWGPGATTTLRRRQASHPNKYAYERCISAAAFDFVSPWIHDIWPLWKPMLCVDGKSKIITVPKSAKTDRTIAIEPGLNLWFQKSIGTMLRRRLLRVGVDLNNQEHNGNLSRIASKFNSLTTVDFSSASDTISYALVERLLPTRWFALLDAFRSTHGFLGDRKVIFEKFSSMGNGFTFELESLIFYVLALFSKKSVGVEGVVSVYGDDVVLPSAAFDVYQTIAGELGFTVNKRKSYSTGYYRESCGSHYWNGTNIKPIFQKEEISATAQKVRFANSVRLLSARRCGHIGCDRVFRKLWERVRDDLPASVPRVPASLSGNGLVVRENERGIITRPLKFGHEGFLVWAFVEVPRKVYTEHIGLLLSRLADLGRTSEFEVAPGRFLPGVRPDSVGAAGNAVAFSGPTRTKKKFIRVRRWDEIGPWL